MARREGNQLTASEVLNVQGLGVSGTYHVENETPSGSINDVNTVFTLANTPTPASSLQLFLGLYQANSGVDYSLSGNTITFVSAPSSGTVLRATYRRAL